MALVIGQTLNNRYRIVAPLGSGGMGAVYRATDLVLNRACALKELVPPAGMLPADVAQLRQQFRQEASVLAHLSHPSLPRVTDFFSSTTGDFLVMDYVEGESLEQKLLQAAAGGLDQAKVTVWADQLLDALEYCHSQNVIHRDIKPANIIVTPQGRAVLVDFGLAKILDPTNAYTKTILRGLGTLNYAPPEQFGHGPLHTDPRSDLYSLGATLYQALTGCVPPSAMQRVADPSCLAAPRACNPALGATVESALLRAMAMDQAQRFQSAAEMRRALFEPDPTLRLQPHLPLVGSRPAPARALYWIAGGLALALILFLAFRAFGGSPGPAASAPATRVPSASPDLLPTLSPPPTDSQPVATETPLPASPPVEPTAVPPTLPPTVPPTPEPSPTAIIIPTQPPHGGVQRIAFARLASDTSGNGMLGWEDNADIYTMDTAGGDLVRLTGDGAYVYSPTWSPDGARIAFYSDVDGDGEIYVMSWDGSDRRQLTNNHVEDGGPSWSPDGSRLAFHSVRDGNKEIYVMEADGSNVLRLTSHAADDQYPAWSPDGRHIAFDSKRDGKRDIWLMDLAGGSLRRLTDNPGDDWWVAWSPDGRRIAYSSTLSGRTRICVIDVDNPSPTCLQSVPNDAASPAWSPDGLHIAFSYWTTTKNCDIYRMTSSLGSLTQLTSGAGWDTRPSWSR